MNNFCTNLKKYRLMTGRTQKEMAQLLDMTPNAYQKYELGTREPRLNTVIEIADILGISLDLLIKGELS